jgi:hypothetical protein
MQFVGRHVMQLAAGSEAQQASVDEPHFSEN